MRTIEKKMIAAVNGRHSMKQNNTTVTVNNGVVLVRLHGNLIYKVENGRAFFTLAGWNTTTTRSRLNALGVGVSQKNYLPYRNGAVISSFEWYEV